MPGVAETSSVQLPTFSIDLDNDDSISVRFPDSPPIYQREKIHEEDVGINLDFVNTISKQILSQGLDALASTTQQVVPLGPSPMSHVTYHPSSTMSLLSIISQLSNQLIQEREEWKTERESLDKTIFNQTQELVEKDEEIEKLSSKLTKVTAMIPELMSFHSPSHVYALFLKE